jgi:anaerobic ribonucleoside-triphosphate reductase
MKLRDARLCINCDEVYDVVGEVYGRCPACASEVFTLISRHMPTLAEFENWINERKEGQAASMGANAAHAPTAR